MAAVALASLVKTYPDKDGKSIRAVDGIDLTIAPGEFMVLVGPSGCGKTSTLRMIAGLEEISGGTVAIDGRMVNGVAPKDRDIAMVFQNYALYPHMTVYENLAFGLKMRKLPRAEIDRRVREAAALLGLEGTLERRPKALSGGQRQRVAVGRAIVRQPKVFLFDEPLSNLDAQMRVAMRRELGALHARLGATMIYVTHDQAEAMTMGDRICVMRDGRIQQVDEPLEIYRHPKNLFVAGFIGTPPMNFFPGTVTEGNGSLFFTADSGWRMEVRGRARRPAAPDPRPTLLGVRPEDVQIGAENSLASARVELSEPMGPETFLHLAAGSTTLVARVPSSARHAAGETVGFSFPPDAIHLFDAKTEEAW